jgi:hypothetical protein
LREIMDRLSRLKDNTRIYGSVVSDLVGKSGMPGDPRYGCFFLIHNKATIALEVLNYFFKLWEKFDLDLGEDSIHKLRSENTERCIEITRSLFIGCMSVVEHCAKRSIELYPTSRLSMRIDELRSRNRYIFLKGIIQESGNLGFIPKAQEDEWINVIIIRNLAVHNNSISDLDKDANVGGRIFHLRKGEMMRGDLDTYVMLSERSVDLYHSWISKLHQDALLNPGQ